jgi:DNA-binding transcriptional ArsR family regulator
MINTLAQILSSRVRESVFRLLFGLSQEEIHVRELARRGGLSEASLRQELRKLKHLELVVDRRSGNRVYFRANQEHPLFHDIRQIVIKTSGLVDILIEALDKADIEIAFVFGSIAQSKEVGHSDVDLMVIGEISLRKIISHLSGISEKIGREINPHAMTAKEYSKRRKSKDHFVNNVLAGPKIFIVGNEDDFKAMGK